jgi:hypothetical protein
MKLIEKEVTINGNKFAFDKKGGVIVYDCSANEMGTVPASILDKIVAGAEAVMKAPADVTIGDNGFEINYQGGGSVDFGNGDRVYSLVELKRIQKISKSLRK